MDFARGLLLKSVMATLVLGGNCFVCEMTVPAALAAEWPAAPAAVRCDDAVVDAMPSFEPSASAFQAQPFSMPECPMSGHDDSFRALSPANDGPSDQGRFSSGLLSAATDVGSATSLFLHFQDSPFGSSGASDRTLALTGTTIKNE